MVTNGYKGQATMLEERQRKYRHHWQERKESDLVQLVYDERTTLEIRLDVVEMIN